MPDLTCFESSSIGHSPDLLGTATVRAPGVCGELVQGMLGEVHFLVTCPIDFFSRVRVDIYQGGPWIEAPDDCPKSSAALEATLAYLERDQLGVRLSVSNPIPRSKGMASSSADVAATIAATGIALGQSLLPEEVARIAVGIEPTDGVMFPGITLLDHREGRIVKTLGPPPPMEIVALDFGGTVDTLEFNRHDYRDLWRSISAETQQALDLIKRGIEQGDPAPVGKGASISSRTSQKVLPKPRLSQVEEFAQVVGAVGVNVGHSGTVIGVLLDARERRGKSTFRQAQQRFPDAEAVYHFRMLGGGLHLVEGSSGLKARES